MPGEKTETALPDSAFGSAVEQDLDAKLPEKSVHASHLDKE
ncbi:hypothetical protein [Pelagicoccus sp. SDUM812003]|nr:hypothetical protein [Pelagicoccus sp. SDUM812003]MDQ8205075.1 hypothetical protein [Pelagicoccus sp. SDUM812003]